MEFWADNNDYYRRVLSEFTPLIQIADLVSQVQNINDDILSDFIDGLTLLPFSYEESVNRQKLIEDFESLVGPMLNVIRSHIESSNHKEQVLKKYVKGDEVLTVEGLEIPITPGKLFDYTKFNTSLILDEDDVNNLLVNYVNFRKRSFQNDTTDEKYFADAINDTTETKEVREQIVSYFNLLKGSPFRRDEDMDKFISLLVNFYAKSHKKESIKLELPNDTFELKRRTKTKFAQVLSPIYNVLSNKDNLKADKDYFDLIRVLNHFSELTDKEIYKMITRDPF